MDTDSNGQRSKSLHEQFYREVGAKIRHVRRQKGLKQETLAQAIGLTRTSQTNIEKGRQRLMLHTFTEIAAVLDIRPQELLPTGAAMLERLGVKLPDTMNPEDRAFIARAVAPELPHEIHSQAKNTKRSGKNTRGKQHLRSSG